MAILPKIFFRKMTTLPKILSREIIKPSSPTPSHLKTHNLSLIDQTLGSDSFIPIVSFYQNTDNRNVHDKTLDLKNSLSQILTKYYPFAGRHAKTGAAHVECNDDGVEFPVGSVDTTLSDFLQNSQREDLDHLFPYSRVWYDSNRESESNQAIPLAVQINHFGCGGLAVAVSLSHKVADASSAFHFIHDWAKMTRFRSGDAELPSDPQFITLPYKNLGISAFSREGAKDCVTKSFMFPNSKINDLKLKVKAMSVEAGQPITNPTRVEVLTWLLYKSAVEAATKTNSGILIPTSVYPSINIRGKMMEPLPEKSIGNYILVTEIPTKNESELKPESFISELRKQKKKIQSLRNIEAAFDLLPNTSSETDIEEHQNKIDGSYFFSSACGYPAYESDFGWGKPVKVTVAGNIRNFFILMDDPNKDGVDALVCLEKKDMAIMQRDPELLAFC